MKRFMLVLLACAVGAVIPAGTRAEEKVIQLTAKKFQFIPDTIRVRQGDRVRIIARSEDVTHGFEIRDLGINERIEPGKDTVIEFTAEKPGEFVYRCSQYCGIGHFKMRGTLYVEPRDAGAS